MSVVPVLAHQGGWDEMLYVLVPIGLFAWLLSLANKRATREQVQRDGGGDDLDETAADDAPPDDEPPS